MFYLLTLANVIMTSAIIIPWYDDMNFRLPQREGGFVGFTREVSLIPRKTHTMKTLSLRPLIFEIKDFLTAEECEYLIYLAKHTGLKDSPTHPQLKDFGTTLDVFNSWDVNSDSFVEAMEFTYIDGKGEVYLTESDAVRMMENLNIDKNGDNKMDFREFLSITGERIQLYFKELYTTKPYMRSRLSRQAWLWHYGVNADLIDSYHQRLSKLTLLPREMVEMSEPLQVVHYKSGGHYHCHQDSDEIDTSVPCCIYYKEHGHCRQCRYLTIMFFLNNVTVGGETAFQLANNDTFSAEAWKEEAPRKCNLAHHCDKSNLRIEPLQGTALLWYNHHVDEQTGWMGDLDLMTYHGGCNVIGKRDKWIANAWINVIGEKNTKEAEDGWLGMDVNGLNNEL